MAKNKTAVATGILSDRVAFALLLMHINHSEYIYFFFLFHGICYFFPLLLKEIFNLSEVPSWLNKGNKDIVSIVIMHFFVCY